MQDDKQEEYELATMLARTLHAKEILSDIAHRSLLTLEERIKLAQLLLAVDDDELQLSK